MGVKVTNNAFGTISAGINSSATTVTVDTGQGARFPTLSAGDFFFATLIDTSNNIEVIKVTARSSDSMTVTRAADNTTARAFSIGDRIELRPTAALFENAHLDNTPTSTGSFGLPKGTTAQQPSASTTEGHLRYDTDDDVVYYSDGTSWSKIVPAATNQTGFRNRIINGDMRVDQRNETTTINGTSVSYNVDRWLGRGVSSAGVFTLVQDTESPTYFNNSLKATITTADSSIASGSSYRVQQFIEGENVRDLEWGTSNAKAMTLSFWVRSSVTGTFGGSVANGDYDRFNVFSYTISSANTWEKKTINITGDTSGTWGTSNNLSIRLNFSLGAGSTLVGSAGSWGSSAKEGVTNQTNLVATNNATWYLTGVQFEEGSSATDFEWLARDVSNDRCYRYYFKYISQSGNYGNYGIATYNGTSATTFLYLPKPMRTGAMTMETNGTFSSNNPYAGGDYVNISSGPSIGDVVQNIVRVGFTIPNSKTGGTSGRLLVLNQSTAYIALDDEL